jgi:hypothetical protein
MPVHVNPQFSPTYDQQRRHLALSEVDWSATPWPYPNHQAPYVDGRDAQQYTVNCTARASVTSNTVVNALPCKYTISSALPSDQPPPNHSRTQTTLYACLTVGDIIRIREEHEVTTAIILEMVPLNTRNLASNAIIRVGPMRPPATSGVLYFEEGDIYQLEVPLHYLMTTKPKGEFILSPRGTSPRLLDVLVTSNPGVLSRVRVLEWRKQRTINASSFHINLNGQ